MRIHPRIYLIGSGELGLSDTWDCHVYLVDGGDEWAMIDAGGGRPASFEMMHANMAQDGVDPSRINHIILTHTHTDHARGAAGWRERLNARVYVPEIERGRMGQEDAGMYPCRIDVGIAHGDVIQVGDLALQAIQVPGHSTGICAYLLEINGFRALFASDIVFQNGIIGLINFEGSEMAPYRKYLPRLAGLGVDALLPGHLLFTMRNGQSHIDSALEKMQRGFVPLSIGQLEEIFRSPSDY